MPDTMPDPVTVRGTLHREWGAVLARLALLDDAGWSTPTRCAGWTVADLVAHTVWGVSMEADAVAGARARRTEPARGRVLAAAADPATLGDALAVAVRDLLTEVDEITPDDLSGTAPMPYGPVPLPLALAVFAMEAGVHSADLAHALGAEPPLAADVVAATVTSMSAFLPVIAANGAGAPDGAVLAVVGPTVDLRAAVREGVWTVDPAAEPTATVGGADSDVLLFLLGRVGADHPDLAVAGDVELVVRFKEYVPGP